MLPFDDLSAILQHLNHSIFVRNFGHPTCANGASAHYGSIPTVRALKLQIYHDAKDMMPDLEDCITNPNSAPRHVAVAHFLSDKTQHQTLPVVVVVGINYTQFNQLRSIGFKVPTVVGTRMHDAAGKVLATCRRVGVNVPLPDFHLVGTNIFPWITRKRWAKLQLNDLNNSIQEAVLLAGFGYNDPIAELITLMKAFSSHVKAVIFHGANNCVPHYGIMFAKRSLSQGMSGFLILLCDNLPPRRLQILNLAVIS